MQPTQEQLLVGIDKAIDLYQSCQPKQGMLPSSPTILGLLQACGVDVPLSQVKICREIVIDQKWGSVEDYAEPRI